MQQRNPVQKTSYLSQVRKFRNLAYQAIKRFPIEVADIKFIRFGENATFKIIGKNKNFVLRIHRPNYHNLNALNEELSWILNLSKKTDVLVPTPILSKNGQLIETMISNDFKQEMNCDVLNWIDGRQIEKSVTPKHLYELGVLTSKLQNYGKESTCKNRMYWNASGLAGDNPTLGSFENVSAISKDDQKFINLTRPEIYKKLCEYEKKFPHKMGLIHSDLHFGNLIRTKNDFVPIDFDDCGFGFFAYDLAISMLSLENNLNKPLRQLNQFKEQLIEGYCKNSTWTKDEEEVLKYLYHARRLSGIGWLNSRADNQRLQKMLPKYAKNVIQKLKEDFD